MAVRMIFLASLCLAAAACHLKGAEAETAESGTIQSVPTATELDEAAKELAACADDQTTACRTMFQISGVDEGLFFVPVERRYRVNCLVVDKAAELSLELARQNDTVRLYLVDDDATRVAGMRQQIDAKGLYGRIAARAESLDGIFFPTFFFDVIVVARPDLTEDQFKEIYRLLKPGKMAFFLRETDVEVFLKNTAAPGAENTRLAQAKGVSIVHRGYDETDNRYLAPPLTRLWTTVADHRMLREADKIPTDVMLPSSSANTVGILRGRRGEVITDADPDHNYCAFQRVPLDAYTGNIVKPEAEYQGREMVIYSVDGKPGIEHKHSIELCSTRYCIRRGRNLLLVLGPEEGGREKRDERVEAVLKDFFDLRKEIEDPYDVETDPRLQEVADKAMAELLKLGVPPPMQYQLVWYHGDMAAKDRYTGEWLWKNRGRREGFWATCCPLFQYANGVVYKTSYRSLLALHPLTGRLLWWHRIDGNTCAQLCVARSLVYQPDLNASFSLSAHLQAFISKDLAGPIAPGDKLVKGKATIGERSRPASATDWPMYHYDPCRTGASPDKEIKPPLKLLWQFGTGGMVRTSPVVVGDTVYVGSCDHKFYALDATTGEKKWVFFADGEIRSSPCVWKNGVYFGCDDGKVYALDKDTGEVIWAYKTATTAPRTLHYFSRSKRVLAKTNLPSRSFTPLSFNGQPLSTPGVVRSSPVVANGIVYVGTGLGIDGRPCWGYLYALDAKTGNLVWKITEPDITEECEEPARGITSPPCFHDDSVHFTYGVYTAVGAAKGDLLLKGGTVQPDKRHWPLYSSYTNQKGERVHYRVSHGANGWGVRGAVAIARDRQTAILVSGPCDREGDGRLSADTLRSGSRVWAVDMGTGEVKWEGRYESDFPKEKGWWRFQGPIPYEEPACIHEGHVYVAGDRGIAVFDLEKGGVEKIDIASRWQRWRAMYYERLRAPWDDRVFKPLRTLTGPADLVFTSPAIANGFIFAGADDGCVYAWNLDAEGSDDAAATGHPPVWKHEIGKDLKVRSSPAIAHGRLYVGADDGCVYCFATDRQ